MEILETELAEARGRDARILQLEIDVKSWESGERSAG